MVLVDTSVWIDHLRSTNPELDSLQDQRQIFIHPMVIGELACGNIRDRVKVLRYLSRLSQIPVAIDRDVLFLIERHQLMGTGIRYIDAHLLTACVLHGATQLWALDRRLMAAADRLGVGYSANS